MSSQPPSPAAHPASSQQHSDSSTHISSSPRSTQESTVHCAESQDRTDPDSSFQSNASERHPKGKRKRTAAKDKAILEAAYNANPKPDKAARLDIVKRVSLNEKEVQIWFQNRRQNDRRKSRPLSPQEIAALQYGSMQVLPESHAAAPYTVNVPPGSGLPAAHNSPVPLRSVADTHDASPRADIAHPRPEAMEHAVEPTEVHDIRRQSAVSVGTPGGPSSSQPVEVTAGHAPQLYRSNSVGYFASRLHAGTALQPHRQSPDSYRHEFMPAPRPSSASTHPVLPPPQSSKFRLSMSMEGKAELIPQPSPPRLSPTALSENSVPLDRPHQHRSHSVAGSITLPPISTLTASLEATDTPTAQSHVLQQPQPRLHPRLYRSRSRDVHLWELACEANSVELRDELTTYAERESSGSAIAAISLLRTLSSNAHSPALNLNGNALQPNSNKRNARHNAHHHHQQQQQHAKKPKLGRASSSVARLQNNFMNMTANEIIVRRNDEGVDEEDDLKKVKMSMLVSSGGHDSDKENWSPGKPSVFRGLQPGGGRRPLPSAPTSKSLSTQNGRRRVLQDGMNRGMLGRSSTAPAARRKKGELPIAIFEDNVVEMHVSSSDEEHGHHPPERNEVTDDEVERFMRGEVSPSKKGAASAIAGLLALSQGHWR
ncbi:hypothetical protein BD289DRAFT_481221 [Coniella lustricola]|uniref:Homeobox domain-containing protein n=1 Tax=Coniella lustricola TaxID=2025994 RepID=A0A2T3ACT2_9PEZI|nr:hypothetical protein BD289DRAFT_481221 [Coniella lustricola]